MWTFRCELRGRLGVLIVWTFRYVNCVNVSVCELCDRLGV